jgi:hypothetical protein
VKRSHSIRIPVTRDELSDAQAIARASGEKLTITLRRLLREELARRGSPLRGEVDGAIPEIKRDA